MCSLQGYWGMVRSRHACMNEILTLNRPVSMQKTANTTTQTRGCSSQNWRYSKYASCKACTSEALEHIFKAAEDWQQQQQQRLVMRAAHGRWSLRSIGGNRKG
jgi:hypothetical protein